LRSLFDPSPPILNATDIVSAFTGRTGEELRLPRRAIVTFTLDDTKSLLGNPHQKPITSWSRFRSIYRIHGADVVVTRSYFGGPNVAALVEELSAFGVTEFVLWGYCGGMAADLSIGDLLIVEQALREDGVSYHYLQGDDAFVSSDWFHGWRDTAVAAAIRPSSIWTCDALYRETRNKIETYRRKGIEAVEMEVASFYAVTSSKNLRGIAFLVVSDLFTKGGWKPGFSEPQFQAGSLRLKEFLFKYACKPASH
jgi:uridine phosphorylase